MCQRHSFEILFSSTVSTESGFPVSPPQIYSEATSFKSEYLRFHKEVYVYDDNQVSDMLTMSHFRCS